MKAAPARPRPFWRRFLLWPSLLLLGLNLAVFFAYTLPRRMQQRSLAERATELREEVAREGKADAALRGQFQVVGANTRDMQRFLKGVVAERDGLSKVLEELEATAKELGLRPERRSYNREELDKLPLVRFEVTLPVAGPYPKLMSFLDALERSPRFVTLEKVTFQDREGGSPGLSLVLSAYLAGGGPVAP